MTRITALIVAALVLAGCQSERSTHAQLKTDVCESRYSSLLDCTRPDPQIWYSSKLVKHDANNPKRLYLSGRYLPASHVIELPSVCENATGSGIWSVVIQCDRLEKHEWFHAMSKSRAYPAEEYWAGGVMNDPDPLAIPPSNVGDIP